jgi:hypothetical protein
MNIILFFLIGFMMFFIIRATVADLVVKTNKLMQCLFVEYLLQVIVFMWLWRWLIW